MNIQTVTSSLIGSIARMAETALGAKDVAIKLAIYNAVGPGGEFPVHYQLALLAINDLDDLHTEVQKIFTGSK